MHVVVLSIWADLRVHRDDDRALCPRTRFSSPLPYRNCDHSVDATAGTVRSLEHIVRNPNRPGYAPFALPGRIDSTPRQTHQVPIMAMQFDVNPPPSAGMHAAGKRCRPSNIDC